MTIFYLRRRILMALAAIAVLLVSVGAAAQDPAVTAPARQDLPPPRSLVERWLDPQTVIAAALVLLYVGELRGDMKRVKERLEDLSDGKLREQFMPREVIDERLRAIEERRPHPRGHV